MPEHKRYTKRLNIYVTAELQKKLEQIRDQRGAQATVPDVVRDAIRAYVDDQEQIIGSRRHFQKTLREEVEAVGASIKQDMLAIHLEQLWAQIFILTTITGGLSPLVGRAIGQNVTPAALLGNAAAQAKQNWEAIAHLLADSRPPTAVSIKRSEK